MANFCSWESDPLFSAAEVVQDSADRMGSIFRMLLHEQSLIQGNPSDPKLISSIEYRRRDLATALGTTKWQLEDFERAINGVALSDKSHMREDAVPRHNQFIRAIREQIALVEKSLEDPANGDFNIDMQWVNLNEQDRDGLALFLSGADSVDHHAHYDSESSIMRRFLDSASGVDVKSDEIVELKTEEIEHSKMNGVKHLDHSFDSFKENKIRKVGSHYSAQLGFGASVPLQGSSGDKECEGSYTGSGTHDLESGASKNRLKGFHSRVDIFGFFGNFWLASGSRMNRNFTKRRKDGEVTDDFILDIEGRPLSSAPDMPQAEQGKQTWMGLLSTFSIRERLSVDGLANTVQLYSWLGASRRAFQRFQYFIQYNRFPIRLILVIFVALILLGLLVFHVA
ncbi:uncharacterized protein LOC143877543 [Tasmannia lanceolata]|uniref:uncharacterized protein LOC143877543 n=1 Tax=Tasmannia lanceolata TaxID=3420 RepID=UPI0040647F34